MKIFLVLILFTINMAKADCLKLSNKESPESIPLHHVEEIENDTIWCFDSLNKNQTLIYAVIEGKTKNELSALLTNNKQGRTILHGSLKNGKLSVHELKDKNLSPFGFSLDTKELKRQGAEPMVHPLLENKSKIHSALFNFLNQNSVTNDFSLLNLEDETVMLDENGQALNGYWWPHRGVPLARPEDAPLRKYDAYVKERHGTDPRSREWELKYHSLEHVSWGGHCNGWAAASVLHDFEEDYLYDPKTNHLFTPSDIQGLRTETSFCVEWAFYGKRNNGNPQDDPQDISPDRFHKVLRYYINNLKKPIAYDYVAGSSVDNSVISGYQMDVTPLGENEYNVKTTVRKHYYSYSKVQIKSIASTKDVNYEYTLKTNQAGQIVSGEWISSNPDFLWVPLAQKKCGRENPRMHHGWVDQMLRNLPHVKLGEESFDFESSSYPIQVNDKIQIDIDGSPSGIHSVYDSPISFEQESGSILITFSGLDYTGNYSEQVLQHTGEFSSLPTTQLKMERIHKLQRVTIQNQGSESLNLLKLELSRKSYFKLIQ